MPLNIQNVFNLDRCVGSLNTLNDLSKDVCVPNKTEDLNLSVFNMITELNLLKTLTKYISYECKCKYDGRKGITINVDMSKKDYIWNPAIYSCEMVNI